MSKHPFNLLFLLLFAALPTLSAFAEDSAELRPFLLKDGQRVVVLGDSITHGGAYVDYLDIFLTTRFPEQRFTVINRGLSSETVAGTSEPGHPGGPRPDLHTRFERTVPPLAPDVVIACYGMNDGIYRSLDDELFKKYRAGIERLIHRVREEADAEIILVSPPPFDRRPTDARASEAGANAGEAGYRLPARDYDATLARYTEWLKTFRDKDTRVVDLHTPINRILLERRKTNDAYLLAGDGIHQNSTGHLLMAAEILEALGAPAAVEKLSASQFVVAESQSIEFFEFTRISKLPFPRDPSWDNETIEIARLDERLNRYTLQAEELPPGRYRMTANGQAFGEATAEQLAAGVDLHDYPEFPTFVRAAEVAKTIRQARALRKKLWIKDDPHPRLAGARRNLQDFAGTEKDAEKLEQQARRLAQPMEIELRFEPIP